MSCICSISPAPPTARPRSSSGMSRPSTVFVACRIEAMMIEPESITVPSKSKRTTGKRMCSIVPRRSVLDALQVEPPRRGGLAGLAARAAGEQRLEIEPLEHRADEDAAHVAKEAHGFDRELQLVAP